MAVLVFGLCLVWHVVNAVLELLLSMLGRCKVVGYRQRNCPWSIAKSAAHSVALMPVDFSIVTEPMPLCSSPLYRAQPSLSFRAKTNARCLPIVLIIVSSHPHTPYSSVQSLAVLMRQSQALSFISNPSHQTKRNFSLFSPLPLSLHPHQRFNRLLHPQLRMSPTLPTFMSNRLDRVEVPVADAAEFLAIGWAACDALGYEAAYAATLGEAGCADAAHGVSWRVRLWSIAMVVPKAGSWCGCFVLLLDIITKEYG